MHPPARDVRSKSRFARYRSRRSTVRAVAPGSVSSLHVRPRRFFAGTSAAYALCAPCRLLRRVDFFAGDSLVGTGRLDAALERRHQVEHLRLGCRRLLLDDLLAGALRLDPLAELLGVRVVVPLRIPVGRQRVDEHVGHLHRLRLRLRPPARQTVDIGTRHDLVGEAHGRHRQHAVERPHRGQVLGVAHDDRADRHPFPVLHRRQQQLVGLLGGVAVGRQPVGPLVVDRVDLGEPDEVGDLDRAGRRRPQLVEFVLVEGHVAALADLEAQLDVVRVDLLARLLRHLAVADARARLLLELVEVHVVVADGGERLDLHVHQTEADRS